MVGSIVVGEAEEKSKIKPSVTIVRELECVDERIEKVKTDI